MAYCFFLQYVPWKETSNIYLSLDKHIAPCGTKLNIVSNGELESLLFIIKDFSTLLQVIGRINNLFIGGFFYDRITEGNELIKELIVLASFSGKFKFYCLPTNGPLSKAFVCVQVSLNSNTEFNVTHPA